ncbi:hypothetical protein CDL12_12968 [Handroanthus impetiginosus]|uniref:Protein Lines C-terminal domain-containing protein n=1 Tax=Handroanthus impetiginosus TaxID=429701 RepID=A0A2G9HA58_9LAMI|nr:hypothetical protein CDL12_12968 [Handroanthus impetiginosus]
MSLLAVKSQYAQHLAGNILVAISEFVLTLDSGWDDFMHLLCLCLELTIFNILTSSTEPGAPEGRLLDYDPSILIVLPKLKLKRANWSIVAAIIRVLRNIQKFLKQDSDDQIMKTYLDSVSSLMLNLPGDVLYEIYVGHNTETLKGLGKDVLQAKILQWKEITVFFGNFIQFLCSLVTQISFPADEVGLSPVICKIINLVPRLAAWCHANLQSLRHVRITQYFRHKVLMLMIKLSSSIHVEQTILITWIHLIHSYFEDLLLQPVSGGNLDHDGLLEDSPFRTSIFDPGKQNNFCCHLQRLTVFLFLKCSLNLVNMKGSPDEAQCSYDNLKHDCTADLNLDSECSSRNVGLAELHKWIQAHIPADILANNELYFERCVQFTLSFLQLFMHEDDILFEMLLQLFRIPSYLDHQIIKDKSLAEVRNRPVFLAPDLFNPIHLFHLFLAEIHYDHQVLLDYLISKDTGSRCAEYLLRSLRSVCDSWNLFVEFPGVDGLDQSCTKRQKILIHCKDFRGVSYPASSKDSINYRPPFFAARDCLVSLRTSIDSLNQKNLFPYNPQVLLQRLMRFQDLCDKL